MGITEQILTIDPLILIIAVSFIVTLITVLAYKFFTNQAKMKELKDGIKDHQKEMKLHKGDSKKLMEIQGKAMQKNMEYMKHSFKPMIFTFLPIIIIFGWLNSHLAYSPILPGQEFTVTVIPSTEFNFSVIPELQVLNRGIVNNTVVIKMKGGEGEYTMYFDSASGSQTANVIVTENQKYANPKVIFKKGEIKSVLISNGKMKPFGKDFNIFGYYPGWFGLYFVATLIFSSLLRKVMKIY